MPSLSGMTMGTSWSVKYWSDQPLPDQNEVLLSITRRLESIDRMMSTYRQDSDLSRFNRSRSLDWQPVPGELAKVVAEAQRISELSNGAYDVTIDHLINLWGFGPSRTNDKIPSQEQIRNIMQATGYKKIDVSEKPPQLRKKHPDVSINLSSIAKGFAVDEVAAELDKLGINNYILEIGGELTTAGKSQRETPWRIAIEKPTHYERGVQLIITPKNQGVATSGDYRNFFEDKSGHRFSHTIDPRSGRPIQHRLASVTVIMPTVMAADAMATAMMAMGPDEAIKLAEQHRYAAFFIIRERNQLTTYSSSEFNQYIPEQ